MGELDDFLTGGEQPAIAEETAEQPETPEAIEAEAPEAVVEQPKGLVRDDKGRFAPKGEIAETPTAEEHTIPVKALQEERRKRQELEQRLAAMEAQNQQPPAPPPSIWEDEDGFKQDITQTAAQRAAFNARLDTSEMLAAQAFADFDEMYPKILEFMGQNPALQQQVLNDRHPWAKAYSIVKNHEKMQALAAVDVSDLEAKIRAELEAKYAAKTVETPPIPDSLASAQSARASSSAQPIHVPSLDEILKR